MFRVLNHNVVGPNYVDNIHERHALQLLFLDVFPLLILHIKSLSNGFLAGNCRDNPYVKLTIIFVNALRILKKGLPRWNMLSPHR